MKIQSVRGTRDFYPDDMALRNWLFARWRAASRRAGFVEVDGPVLEPLDLYTEKSGPEIAEQLYWLEDKGGRRLALRPEFTPTLARMIAARQAALPTPIRWFNISRCFRYERAQKGRLREFYQWNVDLIGLDEFYADAECISVAVDAMQDMGLTPDDVEVRISDRRLLSELMQDLGITAESVPAVFRVLDKRDKVPRETLFEMLLGTDIGTAHIEGVKKILALQSLEDLQTYAQSRAPKIDTRVQFVQGLFTSLHDYGIADWCRFDIGIVRGLAYYTGPVWEVYDRKSEFRAIFGGGRYDRLLADVGGRPMPACGFACGDAVLGLLLKERGLGPAAQKAAQYFVASAEKDNWSEVLLVVRHLRRCNQATQFDLTGGSLKRQMKKAADAGARFVAIVTGEFANSRRVTLRDMDSGEQRDVALEKLGA